MKLSFLSLAALAALIPLPTSLAVGPSYFHITNPSKEVQWTQNAAHAVNWVHSQDDINIVDVELARMGSSGLLFVAREVPARWGSINLFLQDVPPGDDYYVVFLNVTHGIVYSISEQFTILPSSSTTGAGSTSPDSAKPTVTVTGAPNPTHSFAMTFGVDASGAASIFGLVREGRDTWVLGVGCTLFAAIAGGALAML